ncbi:MAG: holo-ACP synthase [Phycisphaerae bacterium]|nr:holo-ACP synthase [Phycisphaerae bacterium]MBN8599156.1 holo-ACP synthase [Planctomycetota bacterium]
MPIVGHGIDLASVERIREMIADHGDRFLHRVFTEGERETAAKHANVSKKVEHLAGRFAAKEAALKALGTGWRDGIAWTDVEISNQPSGAPSLGLHAKAREIADSLGAKTYHVSISHAAGVATASVILES